MKRLAALVVLASFCIRPQFVAAQTTAVATSAPPHNSLSAAKAAAVDAAVAAEMKKQDVVGTAVGILQRGEIVYLKGYGLADRDHRTPVTTETVFNWASNSKPLAAVAAMQLV